ncbi:MAG: hypothetical protein HZC55_07420 [Verrucomicrobia bacterium]|nr:hypothetical protein [Verrucomicrobiota bacterium]
MILTAILLYLLPGVGVGALNYLVEEGDPGNESTHRAVVWKSIALGLVWLPYLLVAIRPRPDRLFEPKAPDNHAGWGRPASKA